MDDLDRSVIAELAHDARVSVAVLARRLKVARSTLQARIERLEQQGVIAGYTVRLGANEDLARIRSTVLVTIEPRAQPAVLTRLRKMAQVERIHTTSGRFDMALQLAARSTAEIDEILSAIGALEGVRSTESLIHLTTVLDRQI